MATILVGGDICPIGRNTPYFERGDAGALFHDLLEDFSAADLVIANLECPLIERPSPILKTGPTFGEATSCINGIAAAGIDVLCLANNHILDHGESGLESTLAACARAGVATVGAGRDLAAARQILVKSVGSLRVGILAMAEHEFSIAAARRAGANPLDVIDFVRNVGASRAGFDYLLVLLHAGLEFLTAPSPRLQDTCRFLVEMGANAVIVQHPHSFGGYEHYRGAHIVYGQGALVMDEAIYRDLRSFQEGMMVALAIGPGGTTSMTLRPLVQSDPPPGARRMDRQRAARVLEALADKSRAILDEAYVSREWKRMCEAEKHDYLSLLRGYNRFIRVANRGGRLARFLYNRRRLLGTRNVVCCESHREVLETILDSRLV